MSTSEWCTAVVCGLLLAAGVWRTLVQGGGFLGGDTYPYFFPQKQLMAECFQRGELPLWHDRTGLGYPLHAESQAGIFYPTNQVLYRLMDINAAYSTSIVLHYWLAFVFAWRFVRTQHITHGPALLAALVYVYGWFPARVSLEWSIIGGVWFPAALWMTDRLIYKPTRQNTAALAVCLGLHLLAGHFALAFITQLACCGYALLTVLLQRRSLQLTSRETLNRLAPVPVAIVLSLVLASVQLLPTMELKRLSQREGSGTVFDPAYGHLPPVYLTQLFASWWYWHTPEMVQSREMMKYPAVTIAADTNPVEAHLYFGLIPLILILYSLLPGTRARLKGSTWAVWSLLSLLAVVYSSGWLVPIGRHLPGFGFFMGPGRYTMIAALGGAIVSSQVLDSMIRRSRGIRRTAIIAFISILTLQDLQWASQSPVRDAIEVSRAPIDTLSQSWVAKSLRQAGASDVRLLAPGPNVGNLYGVSCIPQYLGLGPAEYYIDQTGYRTRPDPNDTAPFPSGDELLRLKERGVTHILATEALRYPASELELIGTGPDSFLNAVWGRGSDPCFLYRFREQPSRVYTVHEFGPAPSTSAPSTSAPWSWRHHTPSDISFEVRMQKSGAVHLRELMFPGWQVTVDDQPAVPLQTGGFIRSVQVSAGEHVIRWIYRPDSFTFGWVLSSASCCCLPFLFWRSRRRQTVSSE